MAENRTQDAVYLEGDLVSDSCDCPVRVSYPVWLLWSQAATEQYLELAFHDVVEHLSGAFRSGSCGGILLSHSIHEGRQERQIDVFLHRFRQICFNDKR